MINIDNLDIKSDDFDDLLDSLDETYEKPKKEAVIKKCIDCDLCVYICPIEVLESINEA